MPLWILVTLGPTPVATAKAISAAAIKGVTLCAPTFTTIHGAQTPRPRRIERPLLLNYAFLHTTLSGLQQLRNTFPQVNPVINRAAAPQCQGLRRYVTVPADTVSTFSRIAATAAAALPVYAPGEIDLTTADTVQIISGPFNGLQGHVIRQQGSRRQRLALEIGSGYIATTIEIEPRYIRVLHFAPNPTHLHSLLASYIRTRLLPLESRHIPSKGTSLPACGHHPDKETAPLSQADRMALQFFQSRFEATDTTTLPPRLRAKLLDALSRTRALLASG